MIVRIGDYLHEIRHPQSRDPRVNIIALVRDFMPWYRSLGGSSLDAARPWITFEATQLLEARVAPAGRIFEYGAGGSTVFFADRCEEVVSVEHDPKWFEVIRDRLAGRPGVTLELAEPRLIAGDADAAVTSAIPEYSGYTFADYVGIADRYPDHHFDVLLIDGRARTSCFFRGESKVGIGGLVIFDDSERPAYREAVLAARAAGWVERGWLGPKPFSIRFSRTTVWTKTRDLDRPELVARSQALTSRRRLRRRDRASTWSPACAPRVGGRTRAGPLRA